MTNHPGLRALIDEINSRYNKRLVFKYKDGKTAVLVVTQDIVTVQTDEPRLLATIGRLLERALQGDVRGLDFSE